jgi:nitroimidazol reductase NimA-like FMN-containing flavoprotein (pyridoxamine 5'-phosphate oxidase superfamily)
MDETRTRPEHGSLGRVARLATVRPDGAPHGVPVVFALDGATVWLVIDEKPQRRLQRLINIAGDPRVSLLVDVHEEDWNRRSRSARRRRPVPTAGRASDT